MKITEVRIKLMDDPNDRLRAFCSITLDDCFVVRDLKIIEGSSGPFVAMPSRKLTSHCPQCRCKNHFRSSYCNQCGLRLDDDVSLTDHDGRTKLYADIAHPINSKCREMIQQRVIEDFHAEMERSKQDDYRSRYDDFDFYDDDEVVVASRGSQVEPITPVRSTEFQSAEPVPRAPHTLVPRKSGNSASGGQSNDNFGSGVF